MSSEEVKEEKSYEQLGRAGECYRCGGTAKQILEFKSYNYVTGNAVKHTRVDLCDEHYQDLRTVLWNNLNTNVSANQ